MGILENSGDDAHADMIDLIANSSFSHDRNISLDLL